MRKIFILFIISSIINLSAFSQANLVPNGSFEYLESNDLFCFTNWCGPFGGPGNCNLECRDNVMYTPSGGPIPLITDWTLMANHQGSPDYFNRAFTLSYSGTPAVIFTGVPTNAFGNQSPFNGPPYNGLDAYAGLFARRKINGAFDLYTEYLQVQLTQSLVAGKRYKAKMYVSRADNCKYACAGLSMLFTNIAANGGGTHTIITTPCQVTSTNVISDKANWVEVSGIFTANGGERYLTIGIFDSNLSAPVLVDPNATAIDLIIPESAYYYIDGVTVVGGDECCQDFQLYQNITTLPSQTIVNNYIRAGSNLSITANQGPVVVQSGQNVKFQANNSISLESGFSVQTGANFTAQIAKCENWDLYPYGSPVLDNIGNVYTGCPGTTWFCINTTNATYYEFKLYNYWGNLVYPSGYNHISSNSTCVWDGKYMSSYNFPVYAPPYDVLSYQLWLYRDGNNCAPVYFTSGNITPFIDCSSPIPVRNDDPGNKSPKVQLDENTTNVKSPTEYKDAESEKKLNASVTSIANNALANRFKIYPNPNNGNMNIEYKIPEMEQGLFEVFDMTNKKIAGYILKGNENTITISNSDFANGVYYYQVISNGKIITKDKLIIIK